MLRRFIPGTLFVLIAASLAVAQEVEVDRYSVNARIDATASAVDVRAGLAVANLGQSPKSKIYLRLNKQAKVSACTFNGVAAPFEVTDDRRASALNQIVISPAASLAVGAHATLELTYKIEAPESSPLIAIYSGEVLLAPDAIWVPMPSTPYTLYGAPTAPVSMTITSNAGLKGASSGVAKPDSNAQSVTFDQPLNSLPVIVAGVFDAPASNDRSGVKISIYAHAGLVGANGAGVRDQIARMSDEAAKAAEFMSRILGPAPPGASFTIISSARTGGLTVPGALVFNEQIFRQDALDASAIELIADGVARVWIEGRAKIRGQDSRPEQLDRPAQRPRSPILLRDSMPRYLASLYIEDRFGAAAASEVYARMRALYTPVALSGRDAEMSVQSMLLPSYGAAAFGKGPLVLRLMAETVGRDKLLGALKSVLEGAPTRIVNIDDFRAASVKAGGPAIDSLFQQWVDSIIEPDIIIGIPQAGPSPGIQRVNLRNLGAGTATVDVLAVTASGRELTKNVTVGPDDLASVDFQTDEKLTTVEVDPRKLIIQKNYDNDSRPIRISSQTLLTDAIAAFNKGEFPQSEAKLKEALAGDSNNSLLQAWMSRVLVSENRLDDASTAANLAIKATPPLSSALAIAHLSLASAAMARGQSGAAAENLRRAIVEAADAPSQFAARQEAAKAERAAGKSPEVDESIRGFISQLDTLIRQPSSDKLFTVVNKNNLKKFVQGLTVNPPASWTSEILRADRIDANRIGLDVAVKATAGGRDQSGTALFILYRNGGAWMLEDIQLFNVK